VEIGPSTQRLCLTREKGKLEKENAACKPLRWDRVSEEPMSQTKCLGHPANCAAVVNPETAIVVSYGDDGTPNCLCDSCGKAAGYL